MAYDLNLIQKTNSNRPPIMAVWGKPKVGKSTFASQADATVFIPVKGEEGVNDLEVNAFPPCDSLAMFREYLSGLLTGEHEYKTLVIDSVTALEKLVHARVAEDAGKDSINDIGYAKGYDYAIDYLLRIEETLERLRNEKGMTIILVGHIKQESFADPLGEDYTHYVPSLHKKFSAEIARWVDMQMFCSELVQVDKNNKVSDSTMRFLFLQPDPRHPAGGRPQYWRYLPNKVPLTWGDFKNAISKAKATMEEKKEVTK